MRFPVFCCRYRLTVVTSKIRIRSDIRCRVSESGIRLKINIRPSLQWSNTITTEHVVSDLDSISEFMWYMSAKLVYHASQSNSRTESKQFALAFAAGVINTRYV